MAQGDGTIRKKGTDRYEVTLSLGRDPVSGKYRRVSRTVRGTKTDARKALAELRGKRDDGLKLDAAKTTVAELCGLWVQAKRASGTCAETTLKGYEGYLKVICAKIGHVRVTDVDARVIETLYAAIREERGISGTTLLSMHTVLKSVFERGIDYDIIGRNPCRRVQAPRKEPVERKALDAGKVVALRTALEQEIADRTAKLAEVEERMTNWGKYTVTCVRGVMDTSCLVAIRVILATGMRRGEAFALTWGDIDLDHGVVHVRHSLTCDGKVKEPKSRAGVRALAIDGGTVEVLKRWKGCQGGYLKRLGVIQGAATPVAIGDAGQYVQLDNVTRFWHQFRKAHGFDGLKLHELRHTQATQLLANGADLKMVQTRLGHASASLTLGTYAHAIPENDARAAAIMGAVMGAEVPVEVAENAASPLRVAV